jgi:Flp pilus assembly protein TadD
MRLPLRSIIAALSLVTLAGRADAAWYQASSKHFVIYADTSPGQLQGFATRLEKFDQAVRAVMHYDDPPLGDGNRLTVFVLSSVGAVQKMAGRQAGNVAGFYEPRAEGCLAFVPKSAGDSDWVGDMTADTVFFHEYTHHLQMENMDKPYPIWLVEGFAEFMETAQFERDGSVVLGGAPAFRAYGLMRGEPIPLPALLTTGYDKLNDSQRDVFYGEGWLLTHFLYMGGGRQGQLSHYLDLLDSGTAPLDAATQSFGDLAKLQHDLNAYKDRGTLLAMKIGADHAQPGAIDVKPLSAGGGAVILLRADLKMHGHDKSAAIPLAQQIQAVEARYPGDELVEATLAEAELDAGNLDSAEAAADRVLKMDQKNVEALIYKGLVTAQRGQAEKGPDRHNTFEAARNLFIAANKIDTEDPEPLFDYYKTYPMEGMRPTDNAISAMHYASDLVPQDLGLRMNSGIAYLLENKLKEARATLSPVAYSPHSGTAGEAARKMIAAIDSGDGKTALDAGRPPATASASK